MQCRLAPGVLVERLPGRSRRHPGSPSRRGMRRPTSPPTRRQPVVVARWDRWISTSALVRDDPEVAVELGMRRDLAQAVAALQRHEIDLASGNAAGLEA